MRLNAFIVKKLSLILLTFLTVSLSANTMVNENGIGVNSVKTTFEITKNKEVKSICLKVDFNKVISTSYKENYNPADAQIPLETLETKVVIDDVVVFLQEDIEMEGLMVYNNTTNLANTRNHLLTHSPG